MAVLFKLGVDKRIHTFSVSLKVSVIERLEIELAYNNFTILYFNHYKTKSLALFFWRKSGHERISRRSHATDNLKQFIVDDFQEVNDRNVLRINWTLKLCSIWCFRKKKKNYVSVLE